MRVIGTSVRGRAGRDGERTELSSIGWIHASRAPPGTACVAFVKRGTARSSKRMPPLWISIQTTPAGEVTRRSGEQRHG